jgi:hypothetical protein
VEIGEELRIKRREERSGVEWRGDGGERREGRGGMLIR